MKRYQAWGGGCNRKRRQWGDSEGAVQYERRSKGGPLCCSHAEDVDVRKIKPRECNSVIADCGALSQ